MQCEKLTSTFLTLPQTVLVGSRALFREDCFDIETVPEDQVMVKTRT